MRAALRAVGAATSRWAEAGSGGCPIEKFVMHKTATQIWVAVF